MQLINNQLEQGIIRYLIDNPEAYYDYTRVFGREGIMSDQLNQDILTTIVKQIIKRDAIGRYELLQKYNQYEKQLAWILSTEKLINNEKEFSSSIQSLDDLHKRRTFFDLVNTAQASVGDDKQNYDSVVANLFSQLIRLDRGVPKTKMSDLFKSLKAQADEIKKGKKYKLDIDQIDNIVPVFFKGHVWIAGAYTGVGKSWFAVHALKKVVEQEGRVAMFTLEMSGEENLARLLGTITGKGTEGFTSLTGNNQDDEVKMEAWINTFDDQVEIIDYCRTVPEVVAECKRMLVTKGLNVVIIDFIQNLKLPAAQLYEAMAQVALHCQTMARDLGVCVVLLSQLSNEFAQQGGVFKFKGAGEIAQIADVGMMIYDHTEKYETAMEISTQRKDGSSFKPILLDIVKSRHSRTTTAAAFLEFPSGEMIPIPKNDSRYWLDKARLLEEMSRGNKGKKTESVDTVDRNIQSYAPLPKKL